MILNIIIVLVSSYLLGSIPFAYIAGHLKKEIDIRKVGNGNMGAANVMRQIGTEIGYAVFAADIAKGLLAIFLDIRTYFSERKRGPISLKNRIFVNKNYNFWQTKKR